MTEEGPTKQSLDYANPGVDKNAAPTERDPGGRLAGCIYFVLTILMVVLVSMVLPKSEYRLYIRAGLLIGACVIWFIVAVRAGTNSGGDYALLEGMFIGVFVAGILGALLTPIWWLSTMNFGR